MVNNCTGHLQFWSWYFIELQGTDEQDTTTCEQQEMDEQDTTTNHEQQKMDEQDTTTHHEQQEMDEQDTTTHHEQQEMDEQDTTTSEQQEHNNSMEDQVNQNIDQESVDYLQHIRIHYLLFLNTGSENNDSCCEELTDLQGQVFKVEKSGLSS